MNHNHYLALAIVLPVASVVLFVLVYRNREHGNPPVAKSDEAQLSEDTPGRVYPSLPGNVGVIPAWLNGAPFDVAAAYAPIPREDNGAALCLDALYEFEPEAMAVCVAPAERLARGPALKERHARMTAALSRDPQSVSPQERQAIVAEYEPAFEKLKRAQQKRFCILEAPLGCSDFFIAHGMAVRSAVKVLHWRTEARIARGELDLALDDMELALRLGRDFRRRGSLMQQLVSLTVEIPVQEQQVPQFLKAPGLTEVQVDRLVGMFARHVDEGADWLNEGLRSEYTFMREVLFRLEKKEDVGALLGTPGNSYGTTIAESLAFWGKPDAGVAARIDAALARMTQEDFAVEVDCLNLFFRSLLDRAERKERYIDLEFAEIEKAFDRSKIQRDGVSSFVGMMEGFRRGRVRTNGARCLVALRRWQMQHRQSLPPDLPTVCREVGLEAVPIDDYSGQPLRWTIIAGEFVIYSVGPDRKDDEARLDWKTDHKTGDWIIRLTNKP